MKAQVIITYVGEFTEQDLKDEVSLIDEDINTSDDYSKFDTFRVSYKILK